MKYIVDSIESERIRRFRKLLVTEGFGERDVQRIGCLFKNCDAELPCSGRLPFYALRRVWLEHDGRTAGQRTRAMTDFLSKHPTPLISPAFILYLLREGLDQQIVRCWEKSYPDNLSGDSHCRHCEEAERCGPYTAWSAGPGRFPCVDCLQSDRPLKDKKVCEVLGDCQSEI